MVKRLVPLVAAGVIGVSLLAWGSNSGEVHDVDVVVYRGDISSSEFQLDCMFQAAFVAEPSLFRDVSLFAVVRNQADWQRLWEPALERGKQYPGSGCPEAGEPPELDVDFEQEMLLLFVELYPTLGYGLKIDGIVIGDGEWTLNATRTTPCCGAFQEFEYLHQVVTTPRFDGDVTLVVTEVERPPPEAAE